MKTSSVWIIRIALMVQFIGVLAVPALVASAESPRATWLAEWVSPQARESNGRTIGILKLRDARLSFDEQAGQGWAIDLPELKRVTISGRALIIESNSGEKFTVAILDSNMTMGSPKRVLSTIDRALQIAGASAAASSR